VGFLPSHWTSAIDGPSARIATVAGVGPARSLRFPHLFFCDRILDRPSPFCNCADTGRETYAYVLQSVMSSAGPVRVSGLKKSMAVYPLLLAIRWTQLQPL
jgi:hypothetical protein